MSAIRVVTHYYARDGKQFTSLDDATRYDATVADSEERNSALVTIARISEYYSPGFSGFMNDLVDVITKHIRIFLPLEYERQDKSK